MGILRTNRLIQDIINDILNLIIEQVLVFDEYSFKLNDKVGKPEGAD